MPKIVPYSKMVVSYQNRMREVKYVENTCDKNVIDEVISLKHYRRIKYGFDVKEGETWLDLGTNIGAFGVYCELRGGRIVGYEPYKPCCDLAKINCPQSLITHSAVTLSKSKTIPFYLLKRGVSLRYRGSCNRTVRLSQEIIVPNISLESILYQRSGEIWDGVKMDIEGREFEFLDHKILPKCKKLVFEYHMKKDKSIERLAERLEWLKTQFDHVCYGDEYTKLIYGENNKLPYFDRLIFCYNDE